MFKYFVLPPQELFSQDGPRVTINAEKGEYVPYSEYNYLRPGLSSLIKKIHFEVALRLTTKYFHKFSAIDFGCADGIFLPSLSKYFKSILAIDNLPISVNASEKLVKELGLDNVQLICNENKSISDILPLVSGKEYQVLFLLETIEHVGESQNMYESKIAFLKEISQLIVNDGIMIISMPKMVGISYLFQRLGLRALGAKVEPMSFKDLLKSVFLCDTTNLEKGWHRFSHLGFNHKYLKKFVTKEFRILKTIDIGFQLVWVLEKK
jgi:2-polyprenyl-3-methyl-5-hydroxy-6-metoxy-1,4-benzoquinol methylase